MIIDEALINSLKTKHPGVDLFQIGDDADAIIARPPSPAEWKAFKAQARDDNKAKALDANAWLVSVCVLWPATEALTALYARRAALPDTFANRLAEIAGADDKVASKKL